MDNSRETIISVNNLSKKFGDITAVDKISFEIYKGEIFGFLGPNGAGKSTTINILTTMLSPTEGDISIAGLSLRNNLSKIRAKIGVIPQNISLEPELTGYENLQFYGSLYHIPQNKLKEKIDEILHITGLYEKRNILVKNYSGGMKRRLEIGKSFLHDPEVIFMDEPTTGLDTQTKQAIWAYIRKINREQGITIFLTTHYLEEADALCDRVAIIDYGK